jgi:hypothetical protein
VILAPYIFMQRPLLYQPIVSRSVVVGTAPVSLDPTGNINQMVASFSVSVPTGAGNCFIGDSNVTVTSGLEIVAGAGAVEFSIEDDNPMLYELLEPLIKIAEILKCGAVISFLKPRTLWDLSQVYVVASAASTIAVNIFKTQFV